MLDNEEIIKCFARDFSYPIACYTQDFITHFINRYCENPVMCNEMVSNIGIFKSFYDFCVEHKYNVHDIRKSFANKIIADLNNYVDKLALVKYEPKYQVPNHNLYICDNIGKYFISIDFIKANFQVFKRFGFSNVDITFEQYVQKMCDIDNPIVHNYFNKSKHFRQVIFGNAYPNKQNVCEKVMTQTIVQSIEQKCPKLFNRLYKIDHDEILFVFENKDEQMELFNFIVQNNYQLFGTYDIRVEAFLLNCVGKREYKFFVKQIDNVIEYQLLGKSCTIFTDIDRISFKNIPKSKFLQVLNEYNHIKSDDIRDMQFVSDGDLVQYVNKIFRS